MRPRQKRCIRHNPLECIYKPHKEKLNKLIQANLTHDMLEALRLADMQGLSQDEAAKLMEISRPTFSRLVAQAREVVATVLVNGWALTIEGGDFTVSKNINDIKQGENNMPGRDRMGPMGCGANGQRRGGCRGRNNVEQFAGRGCGRRQMRNAMNIDSNVDEKTFLETKIQHLESKLTEFKERLTNLD